MWNSMSAKRSPQEIEWYTWKVTGYIEARENKINYEKIMIIIVIVILISE